MCRSIDSFCPLGGANRFLAAHFKEIPNHLNNGNFIIDDQYFMGRVGRHQRISLFGSKKSPFHCFLT